MNTWEERFDEEADNHWFIVDVEKPEIKSFIASEIKKAYQEGFNDGDTKRQLRSKL